MPVVMLVSSGWGQLNSILHAEAHAETLQVCQHVFQHVPQHTGFEILNSADPTQMIYVKLCILYISSTAIRVD